MNQERRQYPRQKLEGPELLDMGPDNGGLVVDISEDGLGFQLVSPMTQDRTLNFAFSLGSNELIRAQGRVVWVSQDGNMGGMKFTALPNVTRKHLRKWLGTTAAEDSPAEAETTMEAPQPRASAVIPSGLGLSGWTVPTQPAAPGPARMSPPVRAQTANPEPTRMASPWSEPMAPPEPAWIPPPARAKAPELPRRAEFPPRDVGNIFSRTPYSEEEADARGNRKFAMFVVVALFLVAGFAAAQLFPWMPGQILAKIRSASAAVLTPAETSKTSPPQSGPEALEKQPAPGATAPASKHSSASADPFTVPRVRATKRTSSTAALSRAYARGMAATTREKPKAAVPPLTMRTTRAPQATAPAQRANPIVATKAPTPPAATPAGNTMIAGQSEYLRGEEYLNGRRTPRDPAQAAHWFWLAESNGYTPAAVALADMYLQGDGIERSCLQARVLLTTAAQKHNKEAEQKLKQLPENCE